MRTWPVADGYYVVPQTGHDVVTESRARLMPARRYNGAGSGLRR